MIMMMMMMMMKRKHESCHCKVCLWLNAKFQNPEQIVPMNASSMEQKYRTINVWLIKQVISLCIKKKKKTVFYLISAHTPISAQSSLSVNLQIIVDFFIKPYVVGTHLNCIDLSMQFKWVPTTYAFIKKKKSERKKKSTKKHRIGIFW